MAQFSDLRCASIELILQRLEGRRFVRRCKCECTPAKIIANTRCNAIDNGPESFAQVDW